MFYDCHQQTNMMVRIDHVDSSRVKKYLPLTEQPVLKSDESSEEEKDITPNFDHLPIEVKEVIFLYLSPKNLRQCSLVCMKWHDIVNSNRIWLKICESHGLSKKRYLEDDYSLIENPLKHFAYSDERLAPSHWRSHFNRYRFVQKNWKNGYYVLYNLFLKPIHMHDHWIIEHAGRQLVMYSVYGKMKKICSVDVASPELKIDTIVCKNNYLIYTQGRTVVCLKRADEIYREVINVSLEVGYCNQTRNRCVKSPFTIRVSDKFIMIQDPLNPCTLTFYETNDSSVKRYVDLHRALGNQSLYCTSVQVLGDSVYLGYRMGNGSYIAHYEYSKDAWDRKVQVAKSRVVELYVSDKFVCAKLHTDTHFELPFESLNLYVWMSGLRLRVGEYCANKHAPVLLTEDDLLIYSFRDEIIIRKLNETHEISFSVSHTIINISRVWDKYLVLQDEKGISVWDYTSGKKIVSPLRSISCITVSASDTNILLRCELDRFLVVSFW